MKLIARFWNEDGVEMPALYLDDEHGLMCTWNWSLAHRTEWAPDGASLLSGFNAKLEDARLVLAAVARAA